MNIDEILNIAFGQAEREIPQPKINKFEPEKAANEPDKKYAYRYEFKNDAGAGIWITNIPLKNAERELLERFIGREIKSFYSIN